MSARTEGTGMTEPDILDEIISERGPHFARLVDAAVERQQLVWRLVELRQAMNRTQTWVAAQMETSQSAIARLERGEIDPRLSTLQR